MINRDMQSFKLQAKTDQQNDFGEMISKWEDVGVIEVAIYKTNDYISTNSIRYNESTHTGLTAYKDIKEGKNRLVDGSTIYNIISSNAKGRLNTLLLKVVDVDV